MKKISFLVVLSLILTCIFPSGIRAEEEVRIKYIVNENFNSLSLGSSPESFTAVTNGNKIYVTDTPSKENKSLRYEVTPGDRMSDVYIQHDVSGIEKKFILEFDIMYKKTGQGEILLCFKDADNKEIAIAYFDMSGNLRAASGELILRTANDKFYNIIISFDLEKKLCDIYVNKKKRETGIRPDTTDFEGISLMRYHLYKLNNNDGPEIYFDNIKMYEAEEPIFRLEKKGIVVKEQLSANASGSATEDEVTRYMNNTVALYENQNKGAVDGEVYPIDADNPEVKVFIENGRTYAPVRFVSEALSYDVDWNEETEEVTISKGEDTVKMTVGEQSININGEEKQIDSAVKIVHDRVFIPVRAVGEAFGKKLTYDKIGLVVIADRENFFDFRDDLGVFRKLSGNLVYRNVSGAEMVERIKANYPGNEHPRLYLNNEKIERIKNDIASDATMAKWLEDVRAYADGMLDKPVYPYNIADGIRLLETSRAVKDLVETLSFTYLVTGEEKYANRAIDELVNVCSYKDWNPSHFLDTAEMVQAVAVGYDWLYDRLSAEQKTLIKNAIVEMGLKKTLDEYNDVPKVNSYKWAQSAAPDNWNVVCNSSAIIAACAVADEDEAVAVEIFDNGMEHIKKALVLYGPDGAWYEGPMYWSYTTAYYTNLMSVLDSVFGDTFGYMETPGIAQTGYYMNALTSSNGLFNFHDAREPRINSPELFFLADMINDGALAKLRIDQMNEYGMTATYKDILWYNHSEVSDSANLPLDYYYRDTEVASMRSNWIDSSSVYVGVHAGAVDVYHGHMDVGSFIIDAFGTRYACDLGTENYDIPDSVWNLYRYRAEGHNTLVINPGTDGGQDLAAATIINEFESGDGSAYSIIDMTQAYKKDVNSAKRGIKLTNNRSMVVVQDEIHAKAPADVWWFMHTKENIEIAPDGKSAVIPGKYKDMYVYLLEDVEGSFSVMDALPMETSPKNDQQNKNKNYRKLAFHAENVTDMTLPIAMSFVIKGEEPELPMLPVTPLDSWTVEAAEDNEILKLDDILINGETIQGFNPDNVMYTYRLTADEEIPEIKAAGSGKVDIRMPDGVPGNVIIKVQSEANETIQNTYVVRLEREILATAPKDSTTFSIKSVEASSVPQPENGPNNAIDGNLNTRWSAEGDNDITFDLGETKTLTYVGIAVYQGDSGDGRQQYFEIHTSEDGKTYNKIYQGETTGTTLESEIFAVPSSKCRYVKIACKGTSVGEWNSITEFSAYGK